MTREEVIARLEAAGFVSGPDGLSPPRRSDFDLTGLVDSTYSPLKEGRILGLEVRGRL